MVNFGIILGSILALLLILKVRTFESPRIALAFFVAIFPLFYIAFAILDGAFNSMVGEFLRGIPFFLAPLLLLLKSRRFVLMLIAILYFTHGLYDLIHYWLLNADYVPVWYSISCTALDFIVAAYILICLYLQEIGGYEDKLIS